ncbi:MAG: glycosyltransferase family 39 protein [Phycisphaeraceae bacterium]
MQQTQHTRPPLTHLPGAVALLSPRHQRVAMALGAVLLAFAVYNLFFALGSHPLYSPDEGRYARVTQVMMENGNPLVPMFEGKPRLKKPPLVHWLGAASMTLLGETEFAARLPSVLATLLAAGAIYRLGAKTRDQTTGLIAAVLLLVSPLTVAIGRMVLIDPLLNGFWTAAMVCGYVGFSTCDLRLAACGKADAPQDAGRRTQARLLFHLFVALTVFVKGPVGLMPMGIVLVWLMLRGQWRAVFHWHWLVGLIVVSLPLLAWAGAVWAMHPGAAGTWYQEIVLRATGEGDHPRPWWYYLPIALGGFFPLTVLLPLPWLHASWRRIIDNFRGGHVIGYLLVAMLLPLVIFSAIKGKLPTYILPMGAPMALIAAWYLRRWLDVTDDATTIAHNPAHPARRIPNGLLTITITMFVVLGGCVAALMIPAITRKLPLDHAMLPGLMRVTLQAMIVPAGLVAAMVLFRKGRTRVGGLLVAGACLTAAINIAMNVESSLMSVGSVPKLLAKVSEQVGNGKAEGGSKAPSFRLPTSHFPLVNTLGFRDPTFSFYADRDIARLDTLEITLRNDPASLANFATPPEAAGKAWVIVTTPEQWAKFTKASPGFTARFEQLAAWQRPVGQWLILREKQGE